MFVIRNGKRKFFNVFEEKSFIEFFYLRVNGSFIVIRCV